MNRSCQVRAEGCDGRAAHTHHRKRRSQGVDNTVANLLVVCVPCHSHIHANPALSYEHGWLVHSWDDPETVPVLDAPPRPR